MRKTKKASSTPDDGIYLIQSPANKSIGYGNAGDEKMKQYK